MKYMKKEFINHEILIKQLVINNSCYKPKFCIISSGSWNKKDKKAKYSFAELPYSGKCVTRDVSNA